MLRRLWLDTVIVTLIVAVGTVHAEENVAGTQTPKAGTAHVQRFNSTQPPTV